MSPDIGGRVRGEGPRLPRLRDRDRRVGRARQAGQVDRGPDGEPAGRLVRAGLPHGRGGSRRTLRAGSRALRIKTLADHGYSDAQAAPSKFPAGPVFDLYGVLQHGKMRTRRWDAVYTNKPPGGVAYRCSFRVTEAVHCLERVVDTLAHKVGKDPATLREENFIPKEAFPYHSPLGWEYDSGDYQAAMDKAKEMIGYDELRREQAEKRGARRADGDRRVCSFTEVLGGGGRRRTSTSWGSRCSTRRRCGVHPTGEGGSARFGTKSQGQGHETTYAQIIAEELGLPAAHVQVEEGGHRYGAVWAGDVREPVDADGGGRRARWRRGRSGTRPGRSRRICWRWGRRTWSGSPASSR